MATRARYLGRAVQRALDRKMVFLDGPRNVGKTSLARSLPGADGGHLSWDSPEERELVLRRRLPEDPLWVFDELHRYQSWRSYLQGALENAPSGQRILVTGSTNLDLHRSSGDMLQGLYERYRLHPFSVAELGIESAEGFEQLRLLGGFPEPLLSGSEQAAEEWSRRHRQQLIYEEVQSVERLRDLGNLELLMLRLPELVGTRLSLNAIREDLGLSHKTVSSWVRVLERMYAVFRLVPFSSSRVRSVKKAQKLYSFDWASVPDPAPRFENLVACHLLKWAHHQQDTLGRDLELRYFRDVDGREVDFVLTERRKPVVMVQCQWTDGPVSRSLRYLKARFPDCDAWQLTAAGRRDEKTPEGIRISPALTLLKTLV